MGATESGNGDNNGISAQKERSSPGPIAKSAKRPISGGKCAGPLERWLAAPPKTEPFRLLAERVPLGQGNHFVGTGPLVEVKFWSQAGNEVDYTELEIRSPYMKAALKATVPEYKHFNIDTNMDSIYPWAQKNRNTWPGGASPEMDFENLWTVYKPGDLIYVSPLAVHTHMKAFRVLRFKSISKPKAKNSLLPSQDWEFEGECIDYDTDGFGFRTVAASVPPYEGYRSYKGVAATLGPSRHPTAQGEDDKFPIRSTWVSSRIMIDPLTMYESRPSNVPFVVQDPARLSADGTNMESDDLVAGFSFGSKEWGVFNIEHVEEVEFAADAFQSSLVLNSQYENMLLSLAQVHENSTLGFDDVIRGKGRGVVCLLHGEPGVGKALAAGSRSPSPTSLLGGLSMEKRLTHALRGKLPERVADHCRKPLMRIEASNLGPTAESIEAGLPESFRLATKWKAVALLDEADVYLEQRTAHDLQRNGLVAEFLRVLEYYEGVLFLTANRVESFDRAFKSRVHLALHFPRLGQASRIIIWSTFLSRVSPSFEAKAAMDGTLDLFAREELNVGQIKNFVRIAQALSLKDGKDFSRGHVQLAVDAMKAFDLDFSSHRRDSQGSSHCLDSGRSEGTTKRRMIE
ncbi:hypothetical protein MKZ38_000172 [Zalerion maritima]|uniref:AAA+ ATPase domain-containing protein n=1 Tax=Zalerion maritima TaxID=339359 RepID=A0AAD5RRW4_9PEZI|nr:hypothetical protein MKZ38_000172 [Zalerion maritima]